MGTVAIIICFIINIYKNFCRNKRNVNGSDYQNALHLAYFFYLYLVINNNLHLSSKSMPDMCKITKNRIKTQIITFILDPGCWRTNHVPIFFFNAKKNNAHD